MDNRNMSDMIESYLKEILAATNQIEIRRSEIAERFDCVPSQINYVINTRFTIPKGYKVESKRGGGGYIRILKIELLANSDDLTHFTELIGSELTESDTKALLNQLFIHGWISAREMHFFMVLLNSKSLLSLNGGSTMRAQMMLELLEHLSYEDGE
ncbi:CtsR family transcriptional regulator [Vagococcus vulneris]|uniref:Transcriptional regulator CtsR n=1 Tax=Vagococcus vulneris TaxID=1977869 RepID=A0A430A093_9ENTE|nr:CtsR family transcriptional regulator [Vagococcus vulneris]RST99725.1 CtsR family transcriptional regulator [Vagococcus vulneris]